MTKNNNKIFFPLNKTEIKQLNETDLDALIELDKQGLLIGAKEDINSYKQRLLNIEKDIVSLGHELQEKGRIELFNKVYASEKDIINTEILQEAKQQTESTYNFSINWIPGFYLSKGLGFLTGGCSATTESGFTFFLIRSSFSSSKKWLWYSRNELLSHELCHSARTAINDRRLEEFFAYKLSTSKLRKYLGNCFQGTYDAILLLTPIFLLLIIQLINTFFFFNLPIWIFWIIAAVYPVFLLIRNQLYRNYYFKARKKLNATLDNKLVDSILFRCTSEEIIEIGKFDNNSKELMKWFKAKEEKELRWKVINKRFIKN